MVTGSSVERVLRIDGKQVPLPSGSWVVAADTASEWNDQSFGAFGYLRTLVLFRIVDGHVDTMLEINTNVLPTTDGWGMAADCSRTDLVLAVVRYRAGWDGSCYFVTHTLLARDPTTGLAQGARLRHPEGTAALARLAHRRLPHRRSQ